ISKKSRSIFMELDANVVSGKNQNILPSQSTNRVLQKQMSINSNGGQVKSFNEFNNDIVKSGEAVEDVKIETSQISEKFKFFEKYHPSENKKRVFRITPPREGVVKMPEENTSEDDKNSKELSPDRNVIVHSRTTSMMLNKFREMEKNQIGCENNSPKPLKCFTPPPDGNRRLYVDQNSDEYDSNDEDDDDDQEDESDDDDDYNNCSHLPKDDEALREALNAARAKQLRIKFEKWQADEIKREKDDEFNQNIYANNVSDENSIESTQSIRDRFEKMRNVERPEPTRPRYQVNRFV
ncbi:pre-rRNA 2'-O-ribose RNA methyltransferase-like, partial [Lucilia sericata]|uniref:pre-rRNA 2'-O-ribose RNA methyltransferase-like n=1 Tax=Lucilia sericata TaxID=13632 RepID=UPI0018A81550